jgi:hypothetical protein
MSADEVIIVIAGLFLGYWIINLFSWKKDLKPWPFDDSDDDSQKAPVKKTPVKKTPVKKAPVKKAPVKKTPVKKAPVKKTPVKKTPVKKTPVKKTPVKKTPVKKTPVKKTPVKKAPVKKTPVKKTPVKKTPVKKTPVKKASAKVPQLNLEEKVGIESSWTQYEVRKHILREFARWNGRLNSIPAGPERENAQVMLNLLAEARKKYPWDGIF